MGTRPETPFSGIWPSFSGKISASRMWSGGTEARSHPVFPQTDAQTAVATLDKLRVEFGKRNHPLPGGGFASVIFSGGVAEFPRSGEDRVSLIAAADSALYASKEGGRNHISLASS